MGPLVRADNIDIADFPTDALRLFLQLGGHLGVFRNDILLLPVSFFISNNNGSFRERYGFRGPVPFLAQYG